ncbi:hypothetical protein EV182_000702 [Spiromyces aspiralis]|uniref:Uncharacterized protein n=1 Tax=Spiromyces aspiralis TaxID=68401 RepID=A0ACC1I070_9FUNG|nr:hypothetical protein EV182_000702 [Spiromyces aspiralis]
MAVRINIPTVSLEERWTAAPLRRSRFTTKHLRFVLVFALLFSLVANIYFLTRPSPLSTSALRPMASDRYKHASLVSELPGRGVDYSRLTHLVVVPGHAIYRGLYNSPKDPMDWFLKPYQRDDVPAYLKHIERGMRMVKEHGATLLVFSGGATRNGAGSRTESQSYWLAAEHQGWITSDIAPRIYTEEFAADSYQNLLFSICRFHEVTGNYPERITVVGFGFKRDRFVNLHRKAINFPKIRFDYIGIDPARNMAKDEQLERENGYKLFAEDMYGCEVPLSTKRKERNPFKRQHGYKLSCPEMSELLDYCPNPPNAVFDKGLPWWMGL